MIREGALDWRMKPIYRRILNRSISIIPAVIITASEGQAGLAAALNGCKVMLSVVLVFLTFPLIWYTSCHKYMRVNVDDNEVPLGVVDGVLIHDTERSIASSSASSIERTVSWANSWPVTIIAWLIWAVAAFNVATLTFLALGIGSES
jgi:metal iron transporter